MWDAIVVGARCAGSPLAMLLARKGYKVLVVDRSTFPSDAISTHVIHPPGVAALARWGLADRLIATGCPPADTYHFDFGPLAITGSAGVAYCPRRTILDKLLVDAAAEAGAEVREGFSVEEIVVEDGRVVGLRGHDKGGATVSERARVVIGADGRFSSIARVVDAETYHAQPELEAGYYTYWSGLPMRGRFEIYIRPERGFAAMETHDGLTMVVGGWPFAEFETNKKDVERHYLAMFDLVPEFAERIRGAKREAKIAGAAVPNFFRKPYGPGWALVGDAGCLKDPITAQGITDAFHDAESLAGALDAVLSGREPFDAALEAHRVARDRRVMPMFDFTCQLARLEPPPPEMQQLLGAVQRRQWSMDAFVRVNAGAMSPADFFAPEHVGRIFAAV